MSMSRHDHFEELISASLSGDLTDAERQELDAHLDTCNACRATLASFADQRRIMAGLRHVAPPRDLGARVRSGIESGAHRDVPWWRRPAFAFAGLGGGLAAVAGALLAIVLLNSAPDDPQVGGGSESPAASVSFSPAPSALAPTTAATPASAEPSATPVATPTPEIAPEPDVYLAYTGPFDNLLLTLRDGRTGDTIRELHTPGPPLAAELSPNGQFLAYISELGQSGMQEVWVIHLGAMPSLQGTDEATRMETPLDEWESVSLGRSVAGSPFLEHLAWSPDSRYLAYTLADVSGGGPDAWLYDASSDGITRLTDTNWYAASWAGDRLLWVTGVGTGQPISDLLSLEELPGISVATADVFQPLLSPDGSKAIYWKGTIQNTPGGWQFVEGAAPYLAEVLAFDQTFEFVNERPLFGDVTIDRDAFTSAAIAWGADSDAYAVWQAQWSGIPQGSGGEYPNVNRVYFGHASDPRGLTEVHAIDEADIAEGSFVVDVKVPSDRHLLITARHPVGGVMEAPTADLILVTRNTGDVPDEVDVFEGPGDDAWFGPGAYDAARETTAP